MTDIATRLTEYPALAPDQRGEVDAYVADHPEWVEQHAEAQAFAALLDAALEGGVDGQAPEGPPGREESPDAVGFRERHDDLAATEDPVRKFERLTGRSLDPVPGVGGNGQARGLPAAPDRPAARAAGRARLVPRWVPAMVAVLVVAYGGLYALSSASISERAQLAALGELSEYAAPTLRGADDPQDLSARLDAALDHVDEARESTLGLYPRYDDAALTAVAADLGAISTEAEPGTSVAQEARLALGRVYLYLGRDGDAARVLGTLVREGGYRASAARRLLDYIRAQDGA